MWDLCCAQWHYDRFFPPSSSAFPANFLYTDCSVAIFHPSRVQQTHMRQLISGLGRAAAQAVRYPLLTTQVMVQSQDRRCLTSGGQTGNEEFYLVGFNVV
jgi:hypothetical protein